MRSPPKATWCLAPSPAWSVALLVSDTEELVLHRHTMKRRSHLGYFHFPVEGKNTTDHKVEPSALPEKQPGDPRVVTPEAEESKPRAVLGRDHW